MARRAYDHRLELQKRRERSLLSCTSDGTSAGNAANISSTMGSPKLLPFYFLLLVDGTVGSKANACKRHADCIGQEICLQGICTEARPTNTHCLNDQGCPRDQGCKLDRCWEEEKSRHYCKAHKDCQLQMLCDKGYCIDAEPTHRLCTVHRDCQAEEACRGKICWAPSSKRNVIEKRCSTYRDCTGNNICLHNRCVQGEPTSKRCVDKSGCDLGEECVQGSCWGSKSFARCVQHGDCYPSMFCHDGTCRDGKPTGYACQQSSDCERKQGCKDNECWALLEKEQCHAHEDCALKELCMDDVCVRAEPTQERCLTDDNCPLRQACKRSQCWKPVDNQQSCSVHDDCYDYDICIGDRCVTGFPTDQKCTTDRYCENNEICKKGYCVKTTGTQGTKCVANEDCDEDMLCQNERCRQAIPTQMECSKNSDCENGACKFDICWEYIDQTTVEGRCSMHDHCEAEKLCNKGVCVVPESSSDRCNTDLECKSTERCKLNVCWTLPETSCTKHKDCGDYGICHKPVCYLARPTTHMCYNDHDCDSMDGGCRFGVCWPRLPTCKEHRQCSHQEICYNGFCRTAEPSDGSCDLESDEQCKPKEMCRHNICWKLSTRNKCHNHEDCDEYSICEEKRCITLRPVDGPCVTNGDCPEGLNCHRNICWDRLP
uniref:DUF7107 domain-containing protein n=1 Tax=Trichuris muris TaxID=70415 RepID=A0A5S6R3G2_TRIMR